MISVGIHPHIFHHAVALVKKIWGGAHLVEFFMWIEKKELDDGSIVRVCVSL